MPVKLDFERNKLLKRQNWYVIYWISIKNQILLFVT
jgi:hypothetical protein